MLPREKHAADAARPRALAAAAAAPAPSRPSRRLASRVSRARAESMIYRSLGSHVSGRDVGVGGMGSQGERGVCFCDDDDVACWGSFLLLVHIG
jgi:hypothetical protein